MLSLVVTRYTALMIMAMSCTSSLCPDDGPFHDEMGLGQDNAGSATRGGFLIAFSQQDDSELWGWDSHTVAVWYKPPQHW